MKTPTPRQSVGPQRKPAAKRIEPVGSRMHPSRDPLQFFEGFRRYYEARAEFGLSGYAGPAPLKQVNDADVILLIVSDLFDQSEGHEQPKTKLELSAIVSQCIIWLSDWYGREAMLKAVRKGARDAAIRAYQFSVPR